MHHRESSAGVWGRWWMDRRRDCCDESAVDLPRSPAVLYPAQSVGRGRLVRKTEDAPETRPGGRIRRSARGKGRQVIVAGIVRTRRSNFGGDSSITGPKRPPNSRDSARCDAAQVIIITRGSQRHRVLVSSAPIGRRPSSCQPIREPASRVQNLHVTSGPVLQ